MIRIIAIDVYTLMQSDQAPRPLDNWNRYARTNPDNVIYFVKKLEQRESMSLLQLLCIHVA